MQCNRKKGIFGPQISSPAVLRGNHRSVLLRTTESRLPNSTLAFMPHLLDRTSSLGPFQSARRISGIEKTPDHTNTKLPGPRKPSPNDNDHSIPTHDRSPQGRKGARIENYIFIRHQQARPPSLTQGSTALRPFYFFLNAQGGDSWRGFAS